MDAQTAGNAALTLGIGHHYRIVCRGADGQIKWVEEVDNLVVTAGRNDILDKYYKGSTYTAAHYVGLKSAGAVNAADTMASHAGWTEVTVYDEAVRATITWGTPASGSVDNSAAVDVFTMSDTVTVAGAFVTTVNTKGGTTGTLVGAADFSVSRSVIDNDVLEVTVTASLTSS